MNKILCHVRYFHRRDVMAWNRQVLFCQKKDEKHSPGVNYMFKVDNRNNRARC